MISNRINTWIIAQVAWAGPVLGIGVHAFAFPEAHNVYYDYYASSARNWLAGHDMYGDALNNYRYSPLFAVLLSPLVLLPAGWDSALWKVVNCGFYAWALGVAARHLWPRRLSKNQTAALFLLALPLSLHSMYNGQANLVMVGAVLLSLTAAAEDRWNRAALWLALATLIKGYPLALAAVLAVLYPRQFAGRFLAALGLGLGTPFLVQAPSIVAAQTSSWLTHLVDLTGLIRERSRAVDHFFYLYGSELGGRTFLVLEMLAGAGVLALSFWHMRQTTDARLRMARLFMLFAAWVALFGPATETCTYVVLAPAVAWALIDAYAGPAGLGTRALLVASLLLMGPLVGDWFGQTVRNFANAHASQPIGAMLFLGYLLGPGTRKPRVSAGPAAPLHRRAA
jgi:hypothetical protein